MGALNVSVGLARTAFHPRPIAPDEPAAKVRCVRDLGGRRSGSPVTRPRPPGGPVPNHTPAVDARVRRRPRRPRPEHAVRAGRPSAAPARAGGVGELRAQSLTRRALAWTREQEHGLTALRQAAGQFREAGRGPGAQVAIVGQVQDQPGPRPRNVARVRPRPSSSSCSSKARIEARRELGRQVPGDRERPLHAVLARGGRGEFGQGARRDALRPIRGGGAPSAAARPKPGRPWRS